MRNARVAADTPAAGTTGPGAGAWRMLGLGTFVAFVTLGMRHAFGFFLDPVTSELAAVNRDSFGLAIAIQNLVWGLSQPFAGIVADRFGTWRVVLAGGLFYAGGLALAAASTSAIGFHAGLGGLVGLGLGCASFAVILGAVGRAFPPETRSRALGIASVGGAAGMFCSVPVTLALITRLGWEGAFLGLAAVAVAVCLAAPFLGGGSDHPHPRQTPGEALRQALRHRGFLLLVLGFSVCGFQLAFLGTHLPAFLLDSRMPLWVGGAALATIGLANIAGTLVCGMLGDIVSKSRLLAAIYAVRSLVTLWYVLAPVSPATTLLFAAVMGITWLGTVPLTTGIVAQVFGVQYMATLVGIVFLMHQFGSFMGAWLGGLVFEATGSYDAVWWVVIVSALLAALVHLAIDERPSASPSGGGPERRRELPA